MSANAVVGVAVPVYNGERFVAQALESVLAQTYPVGDVVVVDDGSDDSSGLVAHGVGAPVRVVRQAHAGIGAARSHALSLVRGDFILPLDADDLLTRRSVEARVKVLMARPEVDIVYGQVRNFTDFVGQEPQPLDELRPAHVPNAMLIRRAGYSRVGPFATGLRVGEALDWLLRARDAGLCEATVQEQVLWRRVHGANNSLVHRGSMSEFPRALKASLDRRRASAGPDGDRGRS
jgi:glycosyltransferase involved in cell wall biosynthesis